MKKLIGAVMAVTLMLAGCAKEETFDVSKYEIAEAGTWKDGTYCRKTEGKNGFFDVTVIIEEGKLGKIEIGENDETAGKGDVAIDTLPSEMISAQSVNVDGVTGATVTSNAIKTAVAECLEEASE